MLYVKFEEIFFENKNKQISFKATATGNNVKINKLTAALPRDPGSIPAPTQDPGSIPAATL